MIPTPATCPAEVKFVTEIRAANLDEKPELTASIPKPIATDRYASPTGAL